MTDDRAERALEDVVAVETLAPGLVRVVTWADAYEVDARGSGCRCPDKEYNDTPRCKHEYSALLATSDRYPTPYVDATDAGTPQVMADGGGYDEAKQLRAYLSDHLDHDDWTLNTDVEGDDVGVIETGDEHLPHELRGAGFEAGGYHDGTVVVTGVDNIADYAKTYTENTA